MFKKMMALTKEPPKESSEDKLALSLNINLNVKIKEKK